MKERGRRAGIEDGEEEEVLLQAMTPSTTDSFDHSPRNSTSQSQSRPAPTTATHTHANPNRLTSYLTQISPTTFRIVYKLWMLLAIDSLADGMTPYSLMNYYVEGKFHLSKSALGDITSASMFLCAVSSIFAGPLSKHIGLINTMVFTHLPSSIASAFIPLPSSVGWTVALLLFRAALNSMDQAPRTAFIAAVVQPGERTGVMGITAMVRQLASSVGPSITGVLAGNNQFWAAFLATGICRVVYDLGLWVLFVNVEVKVRGAKEEEEEGEWGSVDGDAWDGLLSGSEDGTESEGSERGKGEERVRRVV